MTLPAWTGDLIDLPNPPHARDDDGQVHWGRQVEWPDRTVELFDVEMERSLDGYRPDVVAHDAVGELLIEVRVTHAVSDLKAARVRAQGRRMVEIDLSQLHRDTPHDVKAFEHAVLDDIANRSWISCPEAEKEWQVSKEELDEQVAARNREIAQLRDAELIAAQVRQKREAQVLKDKESRRAYVRALEREKHARDLERLMELTEPERIARVLREYQIGAEDRVGGLLQSVSSEVRAVCLSAHEDAWIYGVDPVLWQLLVLDHFVVKRSLGQRFNQRDVAKWVRHSFHPEPVLYRLFLVQYDKRAQARRAGYTKRRLAFWAFTDEENARIPNFYAPVNDFIARLESARVIRRLPAPIGECEVLPVPASGRAHGAYKMPVAGFLRPISTTDLRLAFGHGHDRGH